MNPPPLSAIRWGAKKQVTVGTDETVQVSQFIDLSIPVPPQQLSLALYATAGAGPVPASLQVQWIVSWGAGSTTIEEVFSAAPTIVTAQVPILLLRPAQEVKVRANVVLGADPPQVVNLSALVGPVCGLDPSIWMPC